MSNLLSQASLVMIPSGYKEDIVYSQIPTNGNGDLTFTRASNGTRINSAGLVEVTPWNLLQQSETFDNATWQKSGIAVTANSAANPLTGLTNADNLVAENVTNFHYIYQPITYTTDTYTIFVYLKANGYNWFVIDSGLSNKYSYFNLSTGVLGTAGSGATASIESVGNGWYKCGLTYAGVASSAGIYLSVRNADNGGSFTGNGTGGVLAYGAQLNIGSTAKPYFPTTDRLNVPRLTYQNGGGGCPSLLLEKQSTNLLIYSEQFNQWSTNGTTTSNVAISPDGTQNADRLNYTSGSVYWLDAGVNVTNGTAYTFTLYVKPTSVGDQFRFYIDGGFNVSQTITTDSSDWKRYEWTFTATATTSINPHILLGYGMTSQSILVWGAQLEASSYATSYIPTTSSSATRVADACFKTGISSLIGQTEGTMFVDFYYNLANNTPNGSDKGIMTIRSNGGSYSNEIALLYYGDEGGSYGKTIQVTVSVGGALQCSLKTPQTLTNGYYKVAFAYKQNDFAFYVNGTQIGTDTSGSVPTCDELYLVDPLRINPNTTIKEAVLFPTRLTNAELASLTTI